MVGPNLPFGGLSCGLVLGPLPSGCVWMQEKREICYVWRELKVHEKNYSTCYIEIMVVVLA